MSRNRNRSGASEDGSYSWPERSAPSDVHWAPDDVYNWPPERSVSSDEHWTASVPPYTEPTLDYIPLHPQHRYVTPPPPEALEQERELQLLDRSHEYTYRPPSPVLEFEFIDILNTTLEPGAPSPDSHPNPAEASNVPPAGPIGRPEKRRQDQDGATSGRAQASPRTPSRPTPTTPTRARRDRDAPPATPPSSSSSSSASSSSRAASRKPATPPTRKSPRIARASAGPSPTRTPPQMGSGGFQPPMSSPLRNVAYRAPSEQYVLPTAPVSNHAGPSSGVGQSQPRWHIPSRKHSTGSISVATESSSDSSSSDESEADSRYYYRK